MLDIPKMFPEGGTNLESGPHYIREWCPHPETTPTRLTIMQTVLLYQLCLCLFGCRDHKPPKRPSWMSILDTLQQKDSKQLLDVCEDKNKSKTLPPQSMKLGTWDLSSSKLLYEELQTTYSVVQVNREELAFFKAFTYFTKWSPFTKLIFTISALIVSLYLINLEFQECIITLDSSLRMGL